MPLASHRIRYIVLALVLTWMALMLLPRPAHGEAGAVTDGGVYFARATLGSSVLDAKLIVLP